MTNSIAIIPARGGSKRIPKKNIKNFNERPMIEYAIETAIKSDLFKNIIVSSDDASILKVASYFDSRVITHNRDITLADDSTPTVPVIRDAINFYEKDIEFTYVCCIYPCVPLLHHDMLKNAHQNLLKKSNHYIFPIIEYVSPIQRALKISVNNTLKPIFPENQTNRTQDLEKAYYDSGQFYFGHKELWKSEVQLHSKSIGIIAKPYDFVDIDNLEDWKFAENLHKIKYENSL